MCVFQRGIGIQIRGILAQADQSTALQTIVFGFWCDPAKDRSTDPLNTRRHLSGLTTWSGNSHEDCMSSQSVSARHVPPYPRKPTWSVERIEAPGKIESLKRMHAFYTVLSYVHCYFSYRTFQLWMLTAHTWLNKRIELKTLKISFSFWIAKFI